jgi:ComF family protein
MSGRQIQAALRAFITRALDPALCLGCAHVLEPGQYFCDACGLSLECVPQPCTLCGLENQGSESRDSNPICARCLYDPPRWKKLIAPLIYQGFSRDLLIQLKFSEGLHLANSLATHLVEHFRHSRPQPEVLLPVPLHRERLLERGYNQAFEIARILSQLLDIPLDKHSLLRIRHTESQSGLSASKRARNILGAFAYEPGKVYTHVAVVDDIVTTGATANEIAKTLHKAGVNNVEIWGLARVLGN